MISKILILFFSSFCNKDSNILIFYKSISKYPANVVIFKICRSKSFRNFSFYNIKIVDETLKLNRRSLVKQCRMIWIYTLCTCVFFILLVFEFSRQMFLFCIHVEIQLSSSICWLFS